MSRLRRSGQQVYFVRPVGMKGPVKIGCSVYPRHRLSQIVAWSPFDLELVAVIDGDELLEARFHRKFIESHNRLEWFDWTPELEAAIDAIHAGKFRRSSLPRYAGPISGMRGRLRNYKPIDYEYLDALKEYHRRDWRSVGFYQGPAPAACNFVRLKDEVEKQRILNGLLSFLERKAAA